MNVIITGASRGIGYELVKEYSSITTNKILCTARSKDKLIQLQNECEDKFKNRIEFINGDLNNPKVQEDLLKKASYFFPNGLDVLINNAGYLINKPFLDTSIIEAKQQFDINFFAMAETIKLFHPLLKLSKGHIINISSMSGFQSSKKFAGLSYYSSSKAAVVSLTECLAQEFLNDEITVNTLALGSVQTKMLKEAFPDFSSLVSPGQIASFIYNFSIQGKNLLNGKCLPISLLGV